MRFSIDDGMTFDEKIVAAGNEAIGAWARAGAWCGLKLTEGRLPWDVALTIAPRRVWNRLVEVKLLEDREDGALQFHEFLRYNPSREKVLAERARKVGNVAGYRERRNREIAALVTASVTGNTPTTLPVTSTPCNRFRTADPNPDPDPEAKAETTAQRARAGEGPKPWPSEPAILAELQKHDVLRPVATDVFARYLAGRFEAKAVAKGTKLEWVLDSIGAAAVIVAGMAGATAETIAKKVSSYAESARAPRTTTNGTNWIPKQPPAEPGQYNWRDALPKGV